MKDLRFLVRSEELGVRSGGAAHKNMEAPRSIDGMPEDCIELFKEDDDEAMYKNPYEV